MPRPARPGVRRRRPAAGLRRPAAVQFAALTARPEVIVDHASTTRAHLAVDADGRFLITDRGRSHQVKRFSPAGKPLAAIGTAGPPAVGPYDPLHLNNPNGVAVDTQGAS
ncbi:MAG: hypothetical protein U0736_21020 [Gemmataceae bacterium]